MLFNSFTFIIFFFVVLLLYRLPIPWRWKKFNLLWASYVFYAAWNPPFVLILWFSTIVDWSAGRRLHGSESTAARRGWLALSLSANLGLLAFFKYGHFLIENFAAVLEMAGVRYQPPAPDIILPIGISFYTFQTLSYTIDIYRRRLTPWHSFLDYALYVTFFPQLVAGPIVRARDFLPQCDEPKRPDENQMGWGLALLVFGLFQKIVVADGFLAPIADGVYNGSKIPDMLSAWTGTVAFAGQIYCDFAGYSACAIGVALCLGFRLPENFNGPYGAIGFSDFWRRWHISLSTWLRDYLYISLGGNRKGRGRTYVNLAITMLLGGLWHGAAWTFVVWGLLHGVYLAVERRLRCTALASASLWKTRYGRIVLTIVTFVLVCFAWVFFRAKTFTFAFATLGAMCGIETAGASWLTGEFDPLIVFVIVGGMFGLHYATRNQSLAQVACRRPPYVLAAAIAVMLLAILTGPKENHAFIYFQF